jgi:hypothetical protein
MTSSVLSLLFVCHSTVISQHAHGDDAGERRYGADDPTRPFVLSYPYLKLNEMVSHFVQSSASVSAGKGPLQDLVKVYLLR